MKTSFTTTFKEAQQADLFLKSQGFRRVSSFSDFAPRKTGKLDLVRLCYKRVDTIACVFTGREGAEITCYNLKGEIVTPKVKGKPGPKSKSKQDKKERVVMFFKKSTITGSGGVDALRNAIYTLFPGSPEQD